MRRLSTWEFHAAVLGWRKANCVEDETAVLPDDEANDLAAMIDNHATLH